MAVSFLEPGTSPTQDLNLFHSTLLGESPITLNATLSSATDQTHGSSRSVKSACSSGGNQRRTLFSVDAGANGRTSFWFRIDQLPDSYSVSGSVANDYICLIIPSSFALTIDTSGQLHIIDTTNLANRGSSTHNLSVNTWYRISIAWTVTSTTVNQIKVWVQTGDGGTPVLEINLTNVTVGTASINTIGWGQYNWDSTTHASNTWWNHFYLDDSSAMTDPGDIRCTAKRPTSNGTLNQFSIQIGSGGSGVGTGHSPQVNERPASDSNGWSTSNGGDVEEYTIEGASAGDTNISSMSIVDYMGWVRFHAGTHDPSIRVNNVDTTLSGTADNISNLTRWKVAGSTSYPGGNHDIGLKCGTGAPASSADLYECGIIIAYTNVVSTTLTGTSTPSGARALQDNKKPATGTSTPAGARALQGDKVGTGSTTPSGTLVRSANKVGTGSTTPSGTIVKVVNKILTGTLTPAGFLFSSIAGTLFGTLIPAGFVTKLVNRFGMNGSVTGAGTNEDARVRVTEILQGSVNPTGVVTRQANVVRIGNTQPLSALTSFITRSFSGAASVTGSSFRNGVKVLTGTVVPFGSDVLLTIAKLVAGTLTGVGSIAIKIMTTLTTGSVSPVGAIVNAAQKVLVGSAAPTSLLGSWVVALRRSATLTPQGSILRNLARSFAGLLGISDLFGTLIVKRILGNEPFELNASFTPDIELEARYDG